MSPLHLDRVRKHYGRRGREVVAVDDLTLTVEAGEFLVLVGPSGCGKTTTLRLVAGLEDPDRGAVLVDGRDLRGVPPNARNVAMVFQSGALYPHLTVRDNIAFPLEMRRVPRAERMERVASTAAVLEIADLLDRRPHELSGGERQRVAIGRAIVRDPAFLLLDEPFSSLDPPLRSRLRSELIGLHARRPRTSLHVTHDQEEALSLGQRVAVMCHGRVRQIGAPEEIYEAPADRFVATFVGMPPMNLLDGRVERGSDGQATFVASNGRATGADEGRGAASESIALPASASEYAGRPLSLGIRPTDLEPCSIAVARRSGPTSSAMTDHVTFTGEVARCELLGDRVDVSLRLLSGRSITARIAARDRPTPGTPLTLLASKLHLFEPGPDGRALAHMTLHSPP